MSTASLASAGMPIWPALQASSLLWLAITIVVYALTLALYRRSRAHPLMLPVVTGVLLIMGILHLTGTPYATYFASVEVLQFLVGPATVALAIPLFGQVARLRAIWWPVTVALAAGSAVAIVSAVAIAWALGGSAELLASVAPKSATMPIATGLSERFGGLASLAAVAVAVTGIAGTLLAGPFLRWSFGTLDDATHGFTLGLTAHAIGTARALQISETAGAFAALGMSLNGIMTALLMPLVMLAAGALGLN